MPSNIHAHLQIDLANYHIQRQVADKMLHTASFRRVIDQIPIDIDKACH